MLWVQCLTVQSQQTFWEVWRENKYHPLCSHWKVLEYKDILNKIQGWKQRKLYNTTFSVQITSLYVFSIHAVLNKTAHIFRKTWISYSDSLVLSLRRLLPLSFSRLRQMLKCCFKYCLATNQMMSSPNFSKLKVTAWKWGDVFRMLPSSGHLMTLLIIQNL